MYISIPFRRFFAEKLVQAILPATMFSFISFFSLAGVWELFINDRFAWSAIFKLIIPAILLIFSLVTVLAIFKEPLPQRLSLLQDSLLLETGGTLPTSKVHLPFFAAERTESNSIFSNSEIISLNMNDIRSIRLESSTLSHQLFAHKGGKQYEIAPAATLIEKRWLYEIIRLFYKFD